MNVVIIDYGSGNLRSAAKAFEKVAGGKTVEVTNDAAKLAAASHIVLPGVGDFSDCMKGLKSLPGMIDAMEKQVLSNKKPFLGICVGMQLLAEQGRERGTHKGLGWIKGEVVLIDPVDKSLKIPHMGWNNVRINDKKNPLFSGIEDGEHFYFVHSYHLLCSDKKDVLAEVDYGGKVTAAICRGNIMGTQFHPEKSQENGLKLIKNFLSL